MAKKSAGILLYRMRGGSFEVFLGHPGGPLYTKKDEGVWSIPKGEYDGDEDAYDAARREFTEETGHEAHGTGFELAPVMTKSRKTIRAWAVEGEADPGKVTSNTFEMEWPPRSGKRQPFPEIDRAEWFAPEVARAKLRPEQVPLISELEARLQDKQ
ncbi:MAG TPA: NUDIX domain-containing protein [Candidatus Paceibacterota bacterium]|jgi:predicted NUDIX family NTP pyrophosphohydrolase